MPTPLASAICRTRVGEPVAEIHAGRRRRFRARRAPRREARLRERKSYAVVRSVAVVEADRGWLATLIGPASQHHRKAGGGRADRAAHVQLVTGASAAARQRLPPLHRPDHRDVDHQRTRRSREVAADHVHAHAARASAVRPHRRSPRNRRAAASAASAIDSSASRGAAPIAARSLRLTASARWPIACGRDEGAIEMDALDQRVDGQHLDAIALRLDDRRIVADADQQPLADSATAEPLADARDQARVPIGRPR